MCIASKPWSPGRVTPMIALRFAPSQYASAPTSCVRRQISTMLGSNRPRVFGLVSMTAATSVPSTARSASRSTPPAGSLGTVATSYPHIETVAGFVPCAVSGMTTRALGSPAAEWNARIIMRAASSPCAPAAGWSVTPGSPEISASASARDTMSSNAPCMVFAGWSG
jgi:hypothetical protein